MYKFVKTVKWLGINDDSLSNKTVRCLQEWEKLYVDETKL